MVLVFDQWEKSPAIEAEANILDVFRRDMHEWPPCHIIIRTQFGGRPHKLLSELWDSAPTGWVEVYELPPMQLETRSTREALFKYIRDRVPAAVGASDQNGAKQKEVLEQEVLERRDMLLDELRRLAAAHRDDDAVQNCIEKALTV